MEGQGEEVGGEGGWGGNRVSLQTGEDIIVSLPPVLLSLPLCCIAWPEGRMRTKEGEKGQEEARDKVASLENPFAVRGQPPKEVEWDS